MKLIFIGPQGSGKGTQAKVIAEKLDIAHISTGDLLRNPSPELKEKIKSYVNQGKLVPDELILEILQQRISLPDCQNGFILDGYPRNLAQAKSLDKITKIDKVIEISISDKESIKRLGKRLNCPECHSVFVESESLKENALCKKCSSPLIKREDDKEEAIKHRLEIYHNETSPVLEKYDSIKINGEQSIEKVTQDILSTLEN
tara:strand:+ start:7194 stop:7799 length:606 start_codon:yes stop_codon:yes gene_type:complete